AISDTSNNVVSRIWLSGSVASPNRRYEVPDTATRPSTAAPHHRWPVQAATNSGTPSASAGEKAATPMANAAYSVTAAPTTAVRGAWRATAVQTPTAAIAATAHASIGRAG